MSLHAVTVTLTAAQRMILNKRVRAAKTPYRDRARALIVLAAAAGQGNAAASTERVYVPGQPVPGQSETDPAPLGPGQDVPLTPYTQVVQAYQQAALDASDQSLIPGSERDLIRAYFSSLGEQPAP